MFKFNVKDIGDPEPDVAESVGLFEPLTSCRTPWKRPFVEIDNLCHYSKVTFVILQPGKVIFLAKIYVLEHGLYVLEGNGVYWLN